MLAHYKKQQEDGQTLESQSPPSSIELPQSAGRGRGVFAALAAQRPKMQTSTENIVQATTEAIQAVSLNSSSCEEEAVHKRGTKGVPVKMVANYIRIYSDAETGIFEYEVRFNPAVDSNKIRFKLLHQHSEVLGTTKTFDGVQLYLPHKLPENETILTSLRPGDDVEIAVKIIYKRKKKLSECVQFYNILFDKIMNILNYIRIGRKKFDPSAPKMIPQHKLEIWPGYVTAVDEYEDGVMLCCDVSHRVLLQTTVLEHFKECYVADASNFKNNASASLLGSIVLTRYNNRTYRIDDIDFNMSPMDTFTHGEREITFVEYYKTQYNITIVDLRQPLLINRSERRISGKEEPIEIKTALIPELCFLTGLTDKLRNDFVVMRDIATHTRVSPNQRLHALKLYCQNVENTPRAKEMLSNWGLRLEKDPISLDGRTLGEETIIFGKNKTGRAGVNADFGKHTTNNEVLEAIDVKDWVLIHTQGDMKAAKSFLDFIYTTAKQMGVSIVAPKIKVLANDRNETYVNALRENIHASTQIVVIICPTSRDDRYSAIKKICCAETPVPSQVINARTLKNDAKNRSIIQKIALQMNCKLGGTLWSIKIPLTKTMICGIDTYHDPGQKNNSVSGFVASMNEVFTKWYSHASIHSKKEEFLRGLCGSFQMSLHAYAKVNGFLPERIIIYRDGVGDGQLKLVQEYEIPQMKEACSVIQPGYSPLITFVVVQKRINTRMFAIDRGGGLSNPNPGSILDHSVTRRTMYDFFLISQSVRQGTVSPTHYIVVEDGANFKPDILQQLSYKMCFLYYNWPGTVRVPACCQVNILMVFFFDKFQ